MAVDQEIAVRRVLVLADARFDERSAGQRRKSPGHKSARRRKRFFSHAALGRIRVNRFAMTIERELEAAIFQIWHAIGFSAEIEPCRHQRRSEADVART